jgi:transcription initiation factor TFIIIB Brf1 subunit/transcription initiation factor TFIIB
METRTLAEVRAANADTLHSLLFPERVPAAAVVGCVCLDYRTCTECERILGHSFVAIEFAARKKQRTDPPVREAHVNAGTGQGLGSGSHGVEGFDAAISGMADRLDPGFRSHPPSDRVEGPDAATSGLAERLGTGSHPPSDGVKGSDAAISSLADRPGPGSNGGVRGFEAAISGMAARLGLAVAVGDRAKEVYRKMDKARAWPHGQGRSKDGIKAQSMGPLAYAACLSIACRSDGSALSLRELACAVAADGGAGTRKDIAMLIAHIRRRLGEEEAGQSTGIGMAPCVSTYVSRFGALVRLREEESAAALKAARRLEDGLIDVRHNVDIVAAAVVCMALQRARAIKPGVKERSRVKDVAAATGVSSMTIYAVCRELRPHAERLFG